MSAVSVVTLSRRRSSMSKCEVALRCGAVQSGRSEVNRDDQVRPGCILRCGPF